MLSNLTKSIRTTIEANDVVNRLSAIKSGLSKSSDFQELLNHYLTSSQKQLLLRDLETPHGSKNNSSSQTALLSDIIKNITESPVMTIETAIAPSARLTHLISDKVADTFPNNHILIEIKIDESLVGGAAFCFKGRRYDYSLAKKMKNENI